MSAIELLYKLTACHMVGDYALQSDFLAMTKGANWWHLFAHCVLYSLPFAVTFGYDLRVLALLASHVLVDAAKARWQALDYTADQLLHVVVMVLLYASEVSL